MPNTIHCKHCGRELPEDPPALPRMPCPGCGGVGRSYDASLELRATASVHVSMVQERGATEGGFSESVRAGGAAAHATLDGACLDVAAVGPGSHGEADTLPTCKRLVRFLNAHGSTWAPPTAGESDVDAVSVTGDSAMGRNLQMQVVRAFMDERYLTSLSLEGRAETRLDIGAAADCLWAAVDKKAAILAAPQRRTLTLVLDANRAPGLAFQAVVAAYADRHGADTSALGFAAVYVVGPDDSLVKQLA